MIAFPHRVPGVLRSCCRLILYSHLLCPLDSLQRCLDMRASHAWCSLQRAGEPVLLYRTAVTALMLYRNLCNAGVQ